MAFEITVPEALALAHFGAGGARVLLSAPRGLREDLGQGVDRRAARGDGGDHRRRPVPARVVGRSSARARD